MGLDTVELIISAEDKFSISLQDKQLAEVRTVGDFTRLIEAQIRLADREVNPGLVGDWIKTTLIQCLKVPELKITDRAEFAKDLKLDG